VLAAEDVGLAEPMAIAVVAGCAQAFEWVGMPEGQYHLAEATLYLATAAKSNSVGAYWKRYLPAGVRGSWFHPQGHGYEQRILEIRKKMKRMKNDK